MLVTVILSTLALLSVGLMLWQWWLGMRFPLNAVPSPNACRFGVSILKPLKGCDSHTEDCLRSWFEPTSSGPVQILFGVADYADPVCELVRRLIDAHPGVDAQIVICPKRMGPNAKVSVLIQLSRLAKHEVMVVSDADVVAPHNLLDRIGAAFSQPSTGLVSCLYADMTAVNFWMRLEAVAVNADFWPQVLQARALNKVDFALGAVMAMRRRSLEEIGGFESLVQYLADDFQLGRRMGGTGVKVELCPAVVECRTDPMTARQVWSHQVRWARTIRACNPVQYFFSILGNATFWTTLFAISSSTPVTKLFAMSYASAKYTLSFAITWAGLLMMATYFTRIISALALQRRLTGQTDHFAWWFLPPIKDLVAVGVWASAFLGNTVQWRGHRYRVHNGGKLTELR